MVNIKMKIKLIPNYYTEIVIESDCVPRVGDTVRIDCFVGVVEKVTFIVESDTFSHVQVHLSE